MNENLLLIEEDSYIAWDKIHQLEAEGFKVVCAKTMAQAIEMLLSRIERFDRIVSSGSFLRDRMEDEELRSIIIGRIQAALDEADALIAIRDLLGRTLLSNDAIALEAGRTVEAEELLDGADGTWHGDLTTRFPHCDDNLIPFGVVSVSIDIADILRPKLYPAKDGSAARHQQRMRTPADSRRDRYSAAMPGSVTIPRSRERSLQTSAAWEAPNFEESVSIQASAPHSEARAMMARETSARATSFSMKPLAGV